MITPEPMIDRRYREAYLAAESFQFAKSQPDGQLTHEQELIVELVKHVEAVTQTKQDIELRFTIRGRRESMQYAAVVLESEAREQWALDELPPGQGGVCAQMIAQKLDTLAKVLKAEDASLGEFEAGLTAKLEPPQQGVEVI